MHRSKTLDIFFSITLNIVWNCNVCRIQKDVKIARGHPHQRCSDRHRRQEESRLATVSRQQLRLRQAADRRIHLEASAPGRVRPDKGFPRFLFQFFGDGFFASNPVWFGKFNILIFLKYFNWENFSSKLGKNSLQVWSNFMFYQAVLVSVFPLLKNAIER